MSASTYFENKVLNHYFRGDFVFLALYINSPKDDNIGTEVTGLNYKRQLVSFSDPIKRGSTSLISNAIKIEYPIAGEEWGDISHWAVFDAEEGGNMLAHGTFKNTQSLLKGNRIVIEVDNLKIIFG